LLVVLAARIGLSRGPRGCHDCAGQK
jgi:hypothetical protein